MRFGSRGPSLGYVTENALTMKASEDTVQGHGLGLYAPQLRGLFAIFIGKPCGSGGEWD